VFATVDISNFDVINGSAGWVVTDVQSPVRALATGFRDGGRIDQANPKASVGNCRPSRGSGQHGVQDHFQEGRC
jgi:hypothetical protein